MKKVCSILFAAVLLLAATNVSAAPIWGSDASGELMGGRDSNGNGITGLEDWDAGGFEIDWDITMLGPNQWQYIYTVDVTNGPDKVKDVSHFLLELTNDVTGSDIFTGTSTPLEGPQIYSATSSGNSNPLMPNAFFGVKFDFGGDTVMYTIITNRAPVYGNVYAKDGKTKGNDVVAWNDGLNFADYMTNETLTTMDFIVRPDGNGMTVVPAPAAFFILASGIFVLFCGRKSA